MNVCVVSSIIIVTTTNNVYISKFRQLFVYSLPYFFLKGNSHNDIDIDTFLTAYGQKIL
jgi:hypothetical protein